MSEKYSMMMLVLQWNCNMNMLKKYVNLKNSTDFANFEIKVYIHTVQHLSTHNWSVHTYCATSLSPKLDMIFSLLLIYDGILEETFFRVEGFWFFKMKDGYLDVEWGGFTYLDGYDLLLIYIVNTLDDISCQFFHLYNYLNNTIHIFENSTHTLLESNNYWQYFCSVWLHILIKHK